MELRGIDRPQPRQRARRPKTIDNLRSELMHVGSPSRLLRPPLHGRRRSCIVDGDCRLTRPPHNREGDAANPPASVRICSQTSAASLPADCSIIRRRPQTSGMPMGHGIADKYRTVRTSANEANGYRNGYQVILRSLIRTLRPISRPTWPRLAHERPPRTTFTEIR